MIHLKLITLFLFVGYYASINAEDSRIYLYLGPIPEEITTTTSTTTTTTTTPSTTTPSTTTPSTTTPSTTTPSTTTSTTTTATPNAGNELDFTNYLQKIDNEVPNYSYFPFKNKFQLYAKGEGNFKIALTMYPIESDQLPNYKFFLSQTDVELTKDNVEVLVDPPFDGAITLSTAFQHFEIAIEDILQTTTPPGSFNIRANLKHLVIRSLENDNERRYQVDASLEMAFIGFGADLEAVNMMIDIAQLNNNNTTTYFH